MDRTSWEKPVFSFSAQDKREIPVKFVRPLGKPGKVYTYELIFI